MNTCRQPSRHRIALLASCRFFAPAVARVSAWAVAWVVAFAVASAGCGQAPLRSPCDPACDPGTHCVDNACVPDSPQPDFSVVSVDMSACPSGCSGMTPYCNANGVCVPCVQDSQCPIGKYCKAVGQGNDCVPGCNDDSRCGGGAMKCCGGTCADTSRDASNCGACGTACKSPNGGGACMDGKCTAGACSPGWGDCNQDGTDGCETNLHVDVNNCKACGMACTMANGVGACSDGCYLAACNWGYEDCDSDPSNGCEIAIATDPKNCGQCGKACTPVARAQVGCSFDGCTILACIGAYADCNHTYNDGCETSIGNDVKNCGKCGAVCNQGQVCINGRCTCPVCMLPNAKADCFGDQCGVVSCNAGWADCDGVAMNGCEQNIDSDVNNCGACGNKCGNNLVCVQQSCTCPQCKIPNAKSICLNNVCALDKCLPGFANCDGLIANGCEVDTTTDNNNCNACGNVCGMGMSCCAGVCLMGGGNVHGTQTFNYTGNAQTFKIPQCVYSITLEAWGGQGGDSDCCAPPPQTDGGLGGYAKGNLVVKPGDVLTIYVGSKGVKGGSGGYNGGGNAGQYGGGGGGASDVRTGAATINDRVLVAGGGGGGNCGCPDHGAGGAGGGLNGETGITYQGFVAGGGGTQNAGGSPGSQSVGGQLGTGGGQGKYHEAGGGGGYYGGGGAYAAGGGGGSSFIGNLANATTTSKQQTGDGTVTLTW